METYDLIDIYRIRHPDTKSYTYKHGSGTRMKRSQLDFFLTSNILQESVGEVDSMISVRSDHRAIFLKFRDAPENEKGPSYWKFNASLRFDPEYENLPREQFANWHSEYAICAKTTKVGSRKARNKKIYNSFFKKKGPSQAGNG